MIMISILIAITIMAAFAYSVYRAWKMGVEEGGTGFQQLLNEEDFKIVSREGLEYLVGQPVRKTSGKESPYIILDIPDHEVEFEMDEEGMVDMDGDEVPKKEDMN
jgi:hypothetical protein